MKSIPLGHKTIKGMVAAVSDSDYERLSRLRWRLQYGGRPGLYYARASVEGRVVFMHRLILGARQGQEVDHEDRDGLNNCRENLRLAAHADNMRNRGIQKNNTSGFKGVCWRKKSRDWHAKIKVNGRWVHVGTFKSAVVAAKAYDEKAVEFYGEFARPNFPRA